MKRKLLISGSVVLCGIAVMIMVIHFNQRNWNPVIYPLDHLNGLDYWDGMELRTIDNEKSFYLTNYGPGYYYGEATYTPIKWIDQKREKRAHIFRAFIPIPESETRPLVVRIWKSQIRQEIPPTEYIDVPLVMSQDGCVSEPILFVREFEIIPGVHTLLFRNSQGYATSIFHTEGISPINSD